MLTEYLRRLQAQSRRTKTFVLFAIFFPLGLGLTFLLLPHDDYESWSVQRIVTGGLLSSNPIEDTLDTLPQQGSTGSSGSQSIMDGECVENGAWTAIPPSAHTHSNPGNLPLSAEASFTLPISSPMLYFFGRGSNQGGSVVIDDTCARGSDNVRVSVRAYYATEAALEAAQVCKTRRAQGGDGVGVITPQQGPSEHRMYFAFRVRIPPAHSGRVKIAGLQTDFGNYHISVGKLAPAFDVGQLLLKTSNELVHIENVTAQTINVVSTNARVQADELTGRDLELRTTNAVISGRVNLVAVPSLRDASKARGKLLMQTQNGHLNAQIDLLSLGSPDDIYAPSSPSRAQGTGGSFKIDAHTTNHPLDLKLSTAPLSHTLDLTARTANGACAVTLPRTYEGTFRVSTTNAQPVVRPVREGAPDPAGRGRTRRVRAGQAGSRNAMEGVIVWEGSEEQGEGLVHGDGKVAVATTNAGVQLLMD